MTRGRERLAPHDDRERLLASPVSPISDAMRADIVAGIVQAVIGMLSLSAAADPQPADDPPSMLTVGQAAALLGISRMTVIRKADAGELPCVVVSRGARQKLRRFPRAMIEYLAARGGGAEADLKDCTARWLASVADDAGTA